MLATCPRVTKQDVTKEVRWWLSLEKTQAQLRGGGGASLSEKQAEHMVLKKAILGCMLFVPVTFYTAHIRNLEAMVQEVTSPPEWLVISWLIKIVYLSIQSLTGRDVDNTRKQHELFIKRCPRKNLNNLNVFLVELWSFHFSFVHSQHPKLSCWLMGPLNFLPTVHFYQISFNEY